MAGCASVGGTPSLTEQFLEKCTVPSLVPPPQAVLQPSKEGCPDPVNTQGPAPLQHTSCAKKRNMAQVSKASEKRTEHGGESQPIWWRI